MYKVNPKTRKTVFRIKLPEAHSVSLVGDFNNWHTDATSMKRDKNGVWKVELKLDAGEYQFRYFVDYNYWLNDDEATKVANAFGTDNSLARIQFPTPAKKK